MIAECFLILFFRRKIVMWRTKQVVNKNWGESKDERSEQLDDDALYLFDSNYPSTTHVFDLLSK